MIYVYAVIEPSARPLPALPGLEGRPLEIAASGGVVAAFTGHDASRIQATAETVWQHESVVEALMAKGALLPARFGTVFGKEKDLVDSLTRHAGPLAAGLERVRGCVELGLRALWHPPPAPAEQPAPSAPRSESDEGAGASGSRVETSGSDYMMARLAEQQRRRDWEESVMPLCDGIHAALASEAREATQRRLPTPELLMAAAYLVPWERISPFRSRIGELGHTNPRLRLLCTGPWPPYHFAPTLGSALAPALASAMSSVLTPQEAQNVRA